MIKIKKYSGLNYFDRPELMDTIELDKVLIEGFPVYNEEFENKFDSFNVKVDDFNIVFSLMEDTLSDTGATIKDFFNTGDIYAVRVKYGKVIGGTIDKTSVKINKTFGVWNVSFKVYGFESSLRAYAQQKPVKIANGSLNSFYNVMNFGLFWALLENPGYCAVDTTNLDWVNSRVGFEPHLVWEMWNDLIDEGKVTDVTRWDLFKDLLIDNGLVYKFEIDGINENDYFFVSLVLYFREEGNGDEVEITCNGEFVQGFDVQDKTNEYQFFKKWYYNATYSAGGNLDMMFGVLYNGVDTYTLREKLLATQVVGLEGFENMYEKNDTNGNPSGIYRITPSLGDEFELNKNKVNVVEYSKYFEAVTTIGLDLYRYVITDVYPDGRHLGYLFAFGNATHNYSYPAMWTREGYSIVDVSIPNFTKFRIVNNFGTSTTLYQGRLMQNTVEQWAGLVQGSIAKTYDISLSLLGKFDYKIFDWAYIEGNQCILYKLSDLDLARREVQSYWKQKTGGVIVPT